MFNFSSFSDFGHLFSLNLTISQVPGPWNDSRKCLCKLHAIYIGELPYTWPYTGFSPTLIKFGHILPFYRKIGPINTGIKSKGFSIIHKRHYSCVHGGKNQFWLCIYSDLIILEPKCVCWVYINAKRLSLGATGYIMTPRSSLTI